MKRGGWRLSGGRSSDKRSVSQSVARIRRSSIVCSALVRRKERWEGRARSPPWRSKLTLLVHSRSDSALSLFLFSFAGPDRPRLRGLRRALPSSPSRNHLRLVFLHPDRPHPSLFLLPEHPDRARTRLRLSGNHHPRQQWSWSRKWWDRGCRTEGLGGDNLEPGQSQVDDDQHVAEEGGSGVKACLSGTYR